MTGTMQERRRDISYTCSYVPEEIILGAGLRPLLRDAVARWGRPFFVLDMDIGDPRNYPAGQTATRLEAFVGLLKQRSH